MTLQQFHSKAEVDSLIASGSSSVLFFHGPNSPASEQMRELLTNLAQDLGSIKFGYVNAEEVAEASLAHKIVAVPTVLFFKDKQETSRVNGYKPLEIREATNFSPSVSGGGASGGGQTSLEDRLKNLVKSHKLMLFMKGKPEAPQCGFSRKIVSLLDGLNADYGTFDILKDNEVREGLKKLSNWPTYPQLYLNGELVGGLDVVAEELQDPDFVSTLPVKG